MHEETHSDEASAGSEEEDEIVEQHIVDPAPSFKFVVGYRVTDKPMLLYKGRVFYALTGLNK